MKYFLELLSLSLPLLYIACHILVSSYPAAGATAVAGTAVAVAATAAAVCLIRCRQLGGFCCSCLFNMCLRQTLHLLPPAVCATVATLVGIALPALTSRGYLQLQCAFSLAPAPAPLHLLLPTLVFRFALFRFSINFALTARRPTHLQLQRAACNLQPVAYLFPPPNAVTRKLCNVIFNMTAALLIPPRAQSRAQSRVWLGQGAPAAAPAVALKIINAINGNRNICAAPAFLSPFPPLLPPSCSPGGANELQNYKS